MPIDTTLIQGDLRDASVVQEAMMSIRPDAVMHFAVYALVGESMTGPMKCFLNNVKGGINLFEAIESVGCKRIVFSSTCATYGVPSELPIEENMPQIPRYG